MRKREKHTQIRCGESETRIHCKMYEFMLWAYKSDFLSVQCLTYEIIRYVRCRNMHFVLWFQNRFYAFEEVPSTAYALQKKPKKEEKKNDKKR